MFSLHTKIVGLLCCLVSSASAAETVESVKTKLEAVGGRVTSMTCKERTAISLDHGSGNTTNSDVVGDYEFMKKDGKTFWRLEAKGREVNKTSLPLPKDPATGKTPAPKVMESKNEIDSLMIDDGTNTWKVTFDKAGKFLGTKAGDKATKLQLRYVNHTLADKRFIEMLQQDHSLKMLPDQTIEDKDCFVIEATPAVQKGKAGPGRGVTVFYIRQDTGLIVKVVTNDLKAMPMTTTTRTEVKINPPIHPDRFALPAGITIIDATKN